MKSLGRMSAIICLFLLVGYGCGEENQLLIILKPLRPYVKQVLLDLDEVPDERKAVLEKIAHDVSAQIKSNRQARLTYICTHNSRRSHMAQLWAQTAACYYGIDHVTTFSGGTEATECNIRTIEALRRVGFSVVGNPEVENPVYQIQFSLHRPPMKAFSKLYNEGGNPTDNFIALMCCSKADMECPVVDGAQSRFAIHYVDPKECDDTDEEASTYDARCREIALEMFYLMSQVNK